MAINLEAIRKRAQAATPGPWEYGTVKDDDDQQQHDVVFTFSAGRVATVHQNPSITTLEMCGNGLFVAHARTDIPDLIAEVERLRALLDGAWNAGFYSSGEGWNGEYPFNHPGRPNAEESARLNTQRETDVAELLKEPANG